MSQSKHAHPHGHSIEILSFSEGVNTSELKKLFHHPEVRDRKIVILSIIGALRTGKSFFLDFCLRFLYGNYASINNPCVPTSPSDWMGSPKDPLTGFSWSAGTKRNTIGMNMWSDVFLHTNQYTNEKIAIYVMDTQGLFDNETTKVDNSRIFSLSTLISSIQILNLTRMIQENELEYLHFATELAKFAAQDGTHKSFQRLLFLIRDWRMVDSHECGIEGGSDYLKTVFNTQDRQGKELKEVRANLKSSFDRMECCLMPDPGARASREVFDGRLEHLDAGFTEELSSIIQKLLHPDKLTIKKFNGRELTAAEVMECIETFFAFFKSENFPQAQTLAETTIALTMNTTIVNCSNSYREQISSAMNVEEESKLVDIHERAEASALKMFDDEKKMGSQEHIKRFKAQLQSQIDVCYEIWSKQMTESIRKQKQEKLEAQQEKERNQIEQKAEIEKLNREAEKKELERVLEKAKLEEAHKKALEDARSSNSRIDMNSALLTLQTAMKFIRFMDKMA